ncbi:MAG TPA: molecular chaperone HtpG [Clostridiaceae bacterium]|jgi:molecular chaperone HtpG|nr:molecular chaperone HtpG [Clostridiaceae bacterium]
MEAKSGYVSISTENIFPIIKKWLYSEKDIFIREIVSNACDAINKMKKLVSIGEVDLPNEEMNWKIEVWLDKKKKTITVYDNGIGMTEEEVLKYINQIAFSGVKDFVEKYEGKTDESQIIGHFGLGFYSSFMVSKKVEIDTMSWAEGAEPIHWESNTGMDYSISPSKKINKRGTYVTMHIADDGKEFLDEFKLRETLKKYFSFLPVDLCLIDANEKKKDKKEETEEDKPTTINDPNPLWLKNPSDCTDEEYKEFYRKVFLDFNDPLFWIHLNMDYPYNLKGILYFPKLKLPYDSLEGTIKIFYNQVFVADNIKELIPEFLMLLKGVIDCPDLPLNVSRSFLQDDDCVKTINSHITKKVADKINGLYKTERESYEKYWEDINPFIKFGCLKDDKFHDRVKKSIIYKTTDNVFLTEEEYLDSIKDKVDKAFYYVDNVAQQSQYVKMFNDSGIKVFVMDGPIDVPFMQMIEVKSKEKVRFVRVDSDVANALKSDSDKSREELDSIGTSLEEHFKMASNNEKLKIKVENLKSNIPAILTLSEEGRRMQEMMQMYGAMSMPMDEDMTLVLNAENPVIEHLYAIKDDETKKDDLELLCGQIYDLALLAHKPLEAEDMTRFIERTSKILAMVSKKEA